MNNMNNNNKHSFDSSQQNNNALHPRRHFNNQMHRPHLTKDSFISNVNFSRYIKNELGIEQSFISSSSQNRHNQSMPNGNSSFLVHNNVCGTGF